MRRRRERGSIVVYVAMCLVVLGMLFGAVVPLATGIRAKTTRRSDEMKARLAFDAGVATVQSASLAMTLVLDTPIAVSLDGVTGVVTPTANDAQLPKSLLVTGTMTRNGQRYRYSRVIGAWQPHPFGFALFSKSSLTIKQKTQLGVGGVDGDVFVAEGSLTTEDSNVAINGNAMAATSLNLRSDTIVTGRKLANQNTIEWPTLADSEYRNEATSMGLLGLGSYFLLSGSANGVAFGPPTDGRYAIRFYEGNLTLKGTISGRGTIYVNGNLTIDDDLRYATASALVAFVVKGNVTLKSAATIVEGFVFCDGTFTTEDDFSMTRGAIVARNFGIDKKIDIVRDNAILLDTGEAVRLRLPYYWP